MRMRGFALVAASAGALMLAACSPEQQGAQKLGFSNADEMHDIQTQGWHTKSQYLIDQNNAARKLGFADFDEMQLAKKAGYADKASWDARAGAKTVTGPENAPASSIAGVDDFVKVPISHVPNCAGSYSEKWDNCQATRHNGGWTYTGEFKGGKYEGNGLMINDDGIRKLSGSFRNDAANGIVREETESFRYEGEMVNFVRSGHGRLWYTKDVGDFATGDAYEGQFENGTFNGEGTFTRIRENLEYHGTFRNGQWSSGWTKPTQQGLVEREKTRRAARENYDGSTPLDCNVNVDCTSREDVTSKMQRRWKAFSSTTVFSDKCLEAISRVQDMQIWSSWTDSARIGVAQNQMNICNAK